jgi:mannonate dehydratase
MKMTLRWFGSDVDSVPLKYIRQIPGVKGVVTTLYDIPAGEVWPKERIRAINDEVEQFDLKILGIESVNIHDAIKVGLPERDHYIENYIKTLKNLSSEGIHLVCYNFMPVFDWTRSDLAKEREDGSTVLSYNQDIIDQINPTDMFKQIDTKSNGFVLPGWEPERMARIQSLFKMYKDVDSIKLFENLKYFLEAIMPTCEKYGVKMAIHPDDPAWPVFDLPRIVTDKEKLLKIISLVDSPYNGVTLCTGSLGSNPENDIPDIIRSLGSRIHFAHVRNVRHLEKGKFDEAAHLSSDGSLNMYEIMKAFYDIGFEGIMRPDHGRAIWDEKSMPGYGLYDRALGVAYLNGLWEAIIKQNMLPKDSGKEFFIHRLDKLLVH